MHEQHHSETNQKVDSTGKPYNHLPGDMDEPRKSADAIIEELSAQMRSTALNNPILNVEQIEAFIATGRYRQVLKIQNTVFLSVLLSISPSEDVQNEPFWHCSMALLSAASGKPKSTELWTKREMVNVKRLLPRFLGDAGVKESGEILRYKTALHCFRDLTASELEEIGWGKE